VASDRFVAPPPIARRPAGQFAPRTGVALVCFSSSFFLQSAGSHFSASPRSIDALGLFSGRSASILPGGAALPIIVCFLGYGRHRSGRGGGTSFFCFSYFSVRLQGPMSCSGFSAPVPLFLAGGFCVYALSFWYVVLQIEVHIGLRNC
jgi:hypothetical protein